MFDKPIVNTVGRAEKVAFPEHRLAGIPARVDTGAKTSSVWVSEVKEQDGVLSYVLFGPSSPFYTGQAISTKHYSQRIFISSIGAKQERYVVRLVISLAGRRIRASFSLADRGTQVYPVLIGRNVLRGKFIVDVKKGKPLIRRKQASAQELQGLNCEENS